MSQELLASKVVISEEEARIRSISAASTSVTGAVGNAERGPFDKAVLCTSFDEYQATFGGFTARSFLALAAKGFFENGGSQLWVSRASSSTTTNASVDLVQATVGGGTHATIVGWLQPPYFFEEGDGLHVEVGGSSLVSYDLTFSGTAAVISSESSEPFALSDGQTAIFQVDGGPLQPRVFYSGNFANIGAATAIEVVNVINTSLGGAFATAVDGTIQLTSTTSGSASALAVTGDAAGVLGFSGVTGTGTGTVPNLAWVTIPDLVALAEAADTTADFQVVDLGTTFNLVATVAGALSIQATGSAAIRLGISPDISYGDDGETDIPLVTLVATGAGVAGNLLTAQVMAATNGNTDQFDLHILNDGVLLETFINLSRDPVYPRFIESVVNDPSTGSSLVRATNLANNVGVPPTVSVTTFTGGDDGSEDLTDDGVIGDEGAKTGLHALDVVQDLSILMVPGGDSPAIYSAMLQYCEEYRDGTVFAVLDPPPGINAESMVGYVAYCALENASEYGAIYWPCPKILNPDKSVFGPDDLIASFPSGIIAGVYARTDASGPGGVYVPPAGVQAGRMLGVLGFDDRDTLKSRKRDLVYPHRINPLTTEPGLPFFIDGGRTLKGDGSFPFVAARRGVQFIERSLKKGISFARHRNNTPELRAQVRRTISAFLTTQMNHGAFRSREPAKAFFVDVSDALNTPSVVAAGQLIARVGLATNSPAEFIVIQISQDTRALDAELAAG